MSKSDAKSKTDYFKQFEESAEDAPEETTQKSSEDFAAMLGESLKAPNKKLKVGDKIKGKILVLGKEEVYVSTGTQHDGMIMRRDLLDAEGNCPYQRDDLIELYVTQVRGSEIKLSKNPTDRNIAKDLEDAHAMKLAIPGRIVEVCKGGVRVNIKGKLAFCPISQIDSKHIENPEDYVGKTFDFKITQFSEGGKNIVVSRRKLLDEERELGTVTFLEEHKDGDVVQGRVSRLEKFGAFVELAPGVDGLVHISEIAWSRIGDPSEVLQVGQPVTVKMLKREATGDRVKISLSIKQISPKEERAAQPEGSTPLQSVDVWSKFKVGQIITGKISRKEPYGFFVQLEPGLTGLLHKSRTQDTPEFHFEKFKVNDPITVQIGEIKMSERQISLTLPRDPNEDDWKSHQQNTQSSFGTLADKFNLLKKK